MINQLPEHSLISCILLDSSKLDVVADIVTPDDFAVKKFRIIYEACLQLRRDNTTVDAVTLYGTIGEEVTNSIGGVIVYSELISDAATSEAADYYAKLVRDDSIKRTLRKHADVLSRSLRKQRGDIGQQLAAMRDAVDSLESRRLENSEVHAVWHEKNR
jgi:replicative DNA helicase